MSDPEILSSLPRFQINISHSPSRALYREKLKAVLQLEGEGLVEADFLPLFVLLSVMEINFHRIDDDQSFDLDEDELVPFVSRFEQRLVENIPYIFNRGQARSWLFHSFQTGAMPFFTGSAVTPLEFVSRHLESDSFPPVVVIPQDFHFLILDFYKLHREFSDDL